MVMFPTHVAVGYLLGSYSDCPVAAFLAGSVLPDVLDRPLDWVGVASHGHTVGHSLFVAVPLGIVLTYLFGERGFAVLVGLVVHIAADITNVSTTEGPASAPQFGLWPMPIPPNGQTLPHVTFDVPVAGITHTASPVVLAVELAVVAFAVATFVRDFGLSGRLRDLGS